MHGWGWGCGDGRVAVVVVAPPCPGPAASLAPRTAWPGSPGPKALLLAPSALGLISSGQVFRNPLQVNRSHESLPAPAPAPRARLPPRSHPNGPDVFGVHAHDVVKAAEVQRRQRPRAGGQLHTPLAGCMCECGGGGGGGAGGGAGVGVEGRWELGACGWSGRVREGVRGRVQRMSMGCWCVCVFVCVRERRAAAMKAPCMPRALKLSARLPPPLAANRYQPPTATRRQPPPTASSPVSVMRESAGSPSWYDQPPSVNLRGTGDRGQGQGAGAGAWRWRVVVRRWSGCGGAAERTHGPGYTAAS